MSVVLSQDIDHKQTNSGGLREKLRNVKSVRRTAATTLSVVATPFTVLRRVAGLSAPIGWVKRLTTTVGLVAALLGVPTGIVKLGEFLSPNQLELSGGKNLTLTYRPKHESVECMFHLQAEEFGSRPNQILSAKAWIEAFASRLILNISRPEFVENEARKYQPIIPNGPNPKNMQCTIVFALDDRSREVFQNVGSRRLVVEFKGKDNQIHQVTFSFNIEPVNIDQLFNSPEKQANYLNEDPLCLIEQP